METEEIKPEKKKRSLTFIVAVVLLLISILQLIPPVAFILNIFSSIAGPLWVMLPYLLVVTLFVDIKRRKISKFILLIPTLFLGAYYIFYFQERITLFHIAEKVQRTNPSSIIDFAPEEHSLVFSGKCSEVSSSSLYLPIIDAGAQYIKIPTVYFKCEDQYYSYRVVTPDACRKLRSVQLPFNRRLHCATVSRRVEGKRFRQDMPIRVLGLPEEPTNQKLLVLTEDKKENIFGKSVFITEYIFHLDGEVLGRFRTAKTLALPAFPSLCTLIPFMPVCYRGISRELTELDTYPKDMGEVVKNGIGPINNLLNIGSYTIEELRSFTNHSSTNKVVDDLYKKSEPKYHEDWNISDDDKKGSPSLSDGILNMYPAE